MNYYQQGGFAQRMLNGLKTGIQKAEDSYNNLGVQGEVMANAAAGGIPVAVQAGRALSQKAQDWAGVAQRRVQGAYEDASNNGENPAAGYGAAVRTAIGMPAYMAERAGRKVINSAIDGARAVGNFGAGFVGSDRRFQNGGIISYIEYLM